MPTPFRRSIPFCLATEGDSFIKGGHDFGCPAIRYLANARCLNEGTEPLAETQPQSLIDPSFLFRFEVTLCHDELKWTSKGLSLDERCRLPSFGALSGRKVFADVRMAWNASGIGIHVSVTGKRQLPWCRDSRLDDSDGFHLWIDTRCSPGIHRATQFCHRFLWMPSGGGANRERPVTAWIPINRARANPKPIPSESLKIAAYPRHDGYLLSGFIPSESLTGYDPIDQPRVGLYYAVVDRELGWQTLALGPEYPVTEDPSMWGEARLDSESR
ncbi:DOMON domain-containing protein [Novipirellula artificiosorum]|uniref:Carbohydrate-binding domain-containing protein n=1 Tax=Novipirellula artificiosorum TaxID=2528016 RepID=A0A5C6DG84_9BACT|nr:hypothetical protein [Novipirellula artificiosorum]TWU34994.1 hypothetical protein Poly41_41380 [Novipirellula artificiosorum]